MACIAPPPPVVTASVTVTPGTPRPLRFHPSWLSRNYIDAYGNLDFHCFQRPIVVVFKLRTPGEYFHGDGNESLSYNDGDHAREATVLPPKHYQFPVGVQHLGRRLIWFVYANRWDCGANNDSSDCKKSVYGFYLENSRKVVRHFHPIIQNGGSKY